MAAFPAAESAAKSAAGSSAGPAAVAGAPPGPVRFDPVRRRYLDALARRADRLQGPARALLEQRLADARAAYDQAFDAARAEASAALAELQVRFPEAGEALHRHWADGDFAAMRRLGQRLTDGTQPGRLSDLVRHIDRRSADDGRAAPAAPEELKAVRKARDTWSRLRVDRQLARSLAKLPDNPGPLNSQRLVLRCLQRLQAISPAYLSRLLSQLDTWVWLEQAGAAPPRDGRPRR